MGSFDLLAGLTTQLASTVRLDEIVASVVQHLPALGFGGVWMAVLDEQTGILSTLKQTVDGIDHTSRIPKISAHDVRMPIGRGFLDRRPINVPDPAALHVLERDDDPVPPGALALPRTVYDHLRDRPFASCPLFGSRAQPVGALGLSSYRGHQPIPDEVLSDRVMRAFIDHLGIAMERALYVERLHASLAKAQAATASDAPVKAVGEIASAVAHDLNNLTGIALLAANVGMRSPADALDMLPRIERANRAIADLVLRLQRLARGAAGDGEVAHLAAIAEDLVTMMKPVLRERSIEVELDLPAVPAVRCDRVVVQQIVLNLLVNAHDALADVPPDHRRIRVAVRDDHGAVHLTVADTGPGIAPSALAQLFTPFITTKRDAHLGLGLAASRAALAQWGGRIDGRNAPGGGAVFEISLPSAPSAAAAAQDAGAVPAHGSAPGSILAIDDDADVVYIIRVYLEPLGHSVATATSSAEALALAAGQTFDLVLCDIGMPKQNGIDVCRSLREAGYRGKLVLMTGWENYQLNDEQRTVGCDLVLKKPFLGADLIRAIESLLAGASSSVGQ